MNEAPKKPTGGKSMSTLMSSANAANVTVPSTTSGKQLSRLAASNPNANNEKNVSFNFDRQGSLDPGDNETLRKSNIPLGSSRWNAPYLDNVAPFPMSSLSRQDTSKSLHDLATEIEACREKPTLKRKASDGTVDSSNSKKRVSDVERIARAAEEMAVKEASLMDDAIYMRKLTMNWGCIREEKDVEMKDSTDAKKPSATGDEKEADAATAAKVKFDISVSASKPPSKQVPNKAPTTASANSTSRKPSYVPKFMPPFPPSEENMEHDRQLSISASKVMGSVLSGVLGTRDKKKPKSMDVDKTDADLVRQSVIELGKSTTYWGSGWQESETSKDAPTYTLGVASGEGNASNEAVMKESGMAAQKPNDQVVPLGRASGSRVSKMLEGSMN